MRRRPAAIAIPVHYEGWKHFREGRAAIERELAAAPADFRDRVRWLPIGLEQSGRSYQPNDPTSLNPLTTGGSSQRSRRSAWNALKASRPVSGLPPRS